MIKLKLQQGWRLPSWKMLIRSKRNYTYMICISGLFHQIMILPLRLFGFLVLNSKSTKEKSDFNIRLIKFEEGFYQG